MGVRIPEPIYLHNTSMFKAWLEGNGYEWPTRRNLANLMTEFQREGLDAATRRCKQLDLRRYCTGGHDTP